MVFLRYVFFVVLSFSVGLNSSFCQTTTSKASHGLKLVVQRMGSAIPKLNGTFLYTASLSNDGGSPIEIEAVQMPGGYAGNGQFFPCSLQVWNDARNRWALRRPAKLAEFGKNPNLIMLKVKPGDHLDVCGMYLPAQAGKTGDCARLLFQTRWNGTGLLRVYSNTFIIGRPASDNGNSCAANDHAASSLLHEPGHVFAMPRPQ